MNAPHRNTLSISARRDVANGFALVVVLAMLVIVAVLVVTLLAIARTERATAFSHLERARSGYFAQMGVEQLVGTLHEKIADTNISWISFPGRIVSSMAPGPNSGAVPFGPLTVSTDLYSGRGDTSLTGVLRPPDLNIRILQDRPPATYLITDRSKDPANTSSGTVELPLKWIYVRQNGSLDKADSPVLNDTANPIVGRYAYWADDESSKVNYNLAWRRDATIDGQPVPQGHPSSINLPSLPNMSSDHADQIHQSVTLNNYATIKRLFNSPYDARRLGSEISGAISENKFDVTHYNHDPNTTFFNQPRIVLTTQEKYAPRDADGSLLRYNNPNDPNDPANGAPYFLDILKTANTDPGGPTDGSATAVAPSVIDETKLTKTLSLLVNYLKRSDWPMTSAPSSLQQKYFPIASGGSAADPYRLTQFAIEIIDYVRCKESSRVLVPPLLGVYRSVNQFSTDAQSADLGRRPDVFQGLTRTPFITELGLWVPDVIPASGAFNVKFKVEFYLPPNYGADSVDLASSPNILSLHFVATDGSYILRPVSGPSLSQPISAAECSTGTTILRAGAYVTVTRTVACQNVPPSSTKSGTYSIPPPPAARPDRLALIVAWGPKQNFLQSVPQRRRHEQPVGLWCPIDPPGTSEESITTVETDDPRCNLLGGGRDFVGDWKPANPNTLGRSNSASTLGMPADATIIPQQDTDSSGKISDASLYMPYPKGHAKNPDGLVQSPAELGYIHTGIQRNLKSTPWRTLRLQPSKDPSSVVPDWAFMDLFTVPMVDHSNPSQKSANAVLYPHGTTIAGRINMNAQAQPFGNKDYFSVPMERIYPLKALFEGVRKASGAGVMPQEAEDIARNIYFHTLATGQNPGKHYGNEDTYDSQGEIVEVKGVADRGEESEAVVRGIANLISARGSVFSLYSIGQALKQTPDGRLLVNGEQRLHAIVERFADNPDDRNAKFRTVYFRSLTP